MRCSPRGCTAWACSGTPSDCVKLALFALLKEWPDLVLSGINHGPNLGTDTALFRHRERRRWRARSRGCRPWR
jgi:5'/3'-nucleotidase SurE